MIELLSLVLNGLLGSGLLVSFIGYRTERKKARAGAMSEEMNLVTTSVNSMIEAQKSLIKHNQELITELTQSRRENAELSKKIDDLEKKIGQIVTVNRQIANLLKKLNIDQDILNKLNENGN